MGTETSTASPVGELPAAGATPSVSSQSGYFFEVVDVDSAGAWTLTNSGAAPTAAFNDGIGTISYPLGAAQTAEIKLNLPAPPVISIGRRAIIRGKVWSSAGLSFGFGVMSGTPTTTLVVNGLFAWFDGSVICLASAVSEASTAGYTKSGTAAIPPGLLDIVIDVHGGEADCNASLYVNGAFIGSLFGVTWPTGGSVYFIAVGSTNMHLQSALVQAGS